MKLLLLCWEHGDCVVHFFSNDELFSELTYLLEQPASQETPFCLDASVKEHCRTKSILMCKKIQLCFPCGPKKHMRQAIKIRKRRVVLGQDDDKCRSWASQDGPMLASWSSWLSSCGVVEISLGWFEFDSRTVPRTLKGFSRITRPVTYIYISNDIILATVCCRDAWAMRVRRHFTDGVPKENPSLKQDQR